MKKDLPKVKSPQWYKERNKEIKRLRRNRYSIPEIAEAFGITTQRVSIICRGVKARKLKIFTK